MLGGTFSIGINNVTKSGKHRLKGALVYVPSIVPTLSDFSFLPKSTSIFPSLLASLSIDTR
jgi:hypothetical protein